ncbi:hypothetical protein ACFL5F_06090 [Planctomycetota bacterium]
MNTKQKKALVLLISLSILVMTCTWSVLAEDGLVLEPRSDLSLEGIWTTMTPTPAGTSAIMSLVINSQGSEGMVYTCVGKHPECSVSAYGLSPEAEKVSDLLGYLVRTGANTFRFSVICHGINGAGPELLDIGETLYMVTLTGTAELVDSGTMILNEFTYAAYLPTQDLDGDRLPDEGAVPVMCAKIPQLPFKRLPMFPSCEPTPVIQPSE